MADVKLDIHYALTLTPAEFRLVGLGLNGTLKQREDIAAAKELNIRLLEQRARFLQEQVELSTGALEKATGTPAKSER